MRRRRESEQVSGEKAGLPKRAIVELARSLPSNSRNTKCGVATSEEALLLPVECEFSRATSLRYSQLGKTLKRRRFPRRRRLNKGGSVKEASSGRTVFCSRRETGAFPLPLSLVTRCSVEQDGLASKSVCSRARTSVHVS